MIISKDYQCDTCGATRTRSFKNKEALRGAHGCTCIGCTGTYRVLKTVTKPETNVREYILLPDTRFGWKMAHEAQSRLLAAIVASVGGTVSIPRHIMMTPPKTFYMDENFETNSTIITVE